MNTILSDTSAPDPFGLPGDHGGVRLNGWLDRQANNEEGIMHHFNELNPSEAERLALLAEEMGEAQQAIGKILRHGYESVNPDNEGGPTNRGALTREVGDVLLAISLLTEAKDLRIEDVNARADHKRQTVKRYLHHQAV